MRRLLFVLVLAATPSGILGQPLIYARGILNAASFMSSGLPAGSIARGSLFTIFGARIGPGSGPGAALLRSALPRPRGLV
jgi:hypothetical protein